MAKKIESLLRDPTGQARMILPSMPFWMGAGLVIFIVASWVPLVMAVKARATNSPKPAVHIFQDMDNQPKFRPQAVNLMFADRRAARPPVPGTIERGGLELDDHYFRGFSLSRSDEGQWVADYFNGFPDAVPVSESLIRRGQQRFNIYCAPCHGYDGLGDGIVSRRATELQEPKWVPPTSLHSETVVERANGHLFNTISNGIRNMPGYASQIPVPDRWAIVAYVRALQLSQNATLDDVPEDIRSSIR